MLASYVSLGILLSGFVMLFGYIAHARRHPQPLIGLDLFKTRTFSVGIAGNVASRLGTAACRFNAAHAAGGIRLYGDRRRLHDGADRHRLADGEIHRHSGAALVRLP